MINKIIKLAWNGIELEVYYSVLLNAVELDLVMVGNTSNDLRNCLNENAIRELEEIIEQLNS